MMIDVFDSMAAGLVDGSADWIPAASGLRRVHERQVSFWYVCPVCDRLLQLDGDESACYGCGSALPIVWITEHPANVGQN